jgi:hypothetical protein
MVVCWSHVAKDRPTASQVLAIASAPEFTFLRDVVSLGNVTNVVAAIGLQYGGMNDPILLLIWEILIEFISKGFLYMFYS